MKIEYTVPEIDIVTLPTEDVITTSDWNLPEIDYGW